jgi:hypothetical protein
VKDGAYEIEVDDDEDENEDDEDEIKATGEIMKRKEEFRIENCKFCIGKVNSDWAILSIFLHCSFTYLELVPEFSLNSRY